MALIKSVGSSNAASATTDQGKDTGPDNPAALGYIEVSSTNEPAKTNAEITSTKAFGTEIDLGQHGTNINAYSHQPKTPNEETGK